MQNLRKIAETKTKYGYPTVTVTHLGLVIDLNNGIIYSRQICSWDQLDLTGVSILEKLLAGAEIEITNSMLNENFKPYDPKELH